MTEPRCRDLAAQALGGDAPIVRRAAVSALRFVDDAGADGLIEATLLGDPERAVRASALGAAQFRDAKRHLPAVGKLLRVEASKSLRAEALAQVGRWREVSGALEVILWTAENDPDPELRDAAAALLAG